MPHFALVVGFAQRYQKDAGVGTIVAMMLPYTLWPRCVAWIAIFFAWYLLGLPFGTQDGPDVRRQDGLVNVAQRQHCRRQTAADDTSELLEFLFRLGQALLACGEQTATVELALRRAAAAYGMRRSRVVAFPTAIFISLHDGQRGARHVRRRADADRCGSTRSPTSTSLRDAAQRGEIAPREGIGPA